MIISTGHSYQHKKEVGVRIKEAGKGKGGKKYSFALCGGRYF
jgi:hypothetical protein